MGERHIYVISDLHLGGRPAAGDDAGFQMCPRPSRERIRDFLLHLVKIHTNDSVELVINGDFVDFLAEESDEARPAGSYPFERDSQIAVRKLDRALERASEVVVALQTLLKAGHKVTILIGNHDIELALSEVRRRLTHILGRGEHRTIEFVLDGEAYAEDWFIIEHGNRYDGWNAVNHGELRAYRSARSRGEEAPFEPPPGSFLVAEVMNPLKQRYRFIDLLKPENEGVIPMLLAIEPDCRDHLARLVALYGEARDRRVEKGKAPVVQGFIASPVAEKDQPARDEAQWQATLAAMNVLAEPPKPGLIASPTSDWLHAGKGLWNTLVLARGGGGGYSERLKAALAHERDAIARAYDLDFEEPQYLDQAKRLSAGRAVVMGHTHLARRVRLADGGLYLNTGTWCPTVRLHKVMEALEAKPDSDTLERLVRDSASNRLDDWLSFDCYAAHLHRTSDGPRAELLRWDAGGLEPVAQ